MAEEECGRQGHNAQVRRDGDRRERCREGQGESEEESEGWIGRSEGDSAEETEEDRMTEREPRGSGDMMTASPWGTQESGTEGLQVGARADGSNARKAPSAAADEAGTRGRHWERTGQGEKTEASGEMREV